MTEEPIRGGPAGAGSHGGSTQKENGARGAILWIAED